MAASFRQGRISIRLDLNTQLRLQELQQVAGIPATATIKFALNEQLDKVFGNDGHLNPETLRRIERQKYRADREQQIKDLDNGE